jgi:hypothetical protein
VTHLRAKAQILKVAINAGLKACSTQKPNKKASLAPGGFPLNPGSALPRFLFLGEQLVISETG